MFKVNNRNTRKRCETCSKLTIKTPERHCRSGVFIANFEHMSHLFLMFLMLTLNKQKIVGNEFPDDNKATRCRGTFRTLSNLLQV